MSSTSLTDAAMQNWPLSLKKLDLENCGNPMTDRAVDPQAGFTGAALARLSNLNQLSIKNCDSLSAAGMDQFVGALQQLETLDASGSPISCAQIGQLRQLKKLTLTQYDDHTETPIERKGVAYLPASLETLDLSGASIDFGANLLALRSLKTLILYDYQEPLPEPIDLPYSLSKLLTSSQNITPELHAQFARCDIDLAHR